MFRSILISIQITILNEIYAKSWLKLAGYHDSSISYISFCNFLIGRNSKILVPILLIFLITWKTGLNKRATLIQSNNFLIRFNKDPSFD